ncbi:hypothetical protein J4G33_04670 [Actinotalea sp. BY-33]|uniref:Uncharacterized protein n=1 Tax=Actinotalea soli TaxID=2819234 RepID=A0A939LMT9_9CELL|nr:hypothetical protein [Actinotalea soli]MBO1751092.1 hypothetical protein [Actinotalea soli]
MSERWQGWAARLDHPDLPPPIAAAVARRGTTEERHALVANRALSHDVLLTIITTNEPEIASGLLLNYDLPAEMVDVLAERLALPEEVASGHPNASLARKMRQPVGELTGLALHRFFLAVRASETQQRQVHEAIDQDGGQALTTVWGAVRPVGS